MASGNYSVTVTNGGGCSASSAATSVTVFPAPTATFGAISSVCVYDAPMTLTQGAPAGGTYSGNGVSGGQFDPAAGGLGTSTLAYVYQDANGCTDTATTTILVDGCAGLNEYASANIHVYPNPSAGLFTIDAGTMQIARVLIYDNAGRLVQTVHGNNASTTAVDLTKMADGMYTVQVMTATLSQRIPVVMNK
jgi:hypothetical protein